MKSRLVVCLLASAASVAHGQAVGFPSAIENKSFQTSLRAWRPYFDPAGSGAASWRLFDSGNPMSGAMVLANHDQPTGAFDVGRTAALQCIANAQEGVSFEAGVTANALPGQPLSSSAGGAIAWLSLGFYSGRACSGYLSETSDSIEFYEDGTLGPWHLLATAVSPAGTHSLLVVVGHDRFMGNPAGSSEVYFDNARLLGQFRPVKGDFNGGGETDLVLVNTATNEHRLWLMNDDVRLVDPVAISPGVLAGLRAVGSDDFNADGRSDLLMWNSTSGAAEFWLMNSAVRSGSSVALSGALAPPWRPAATGDFTHDGKPDVVYRNDATQKIQIWTMNGTAHAGTIVPTPDQAADANWEIVGAVDLNADGNTDLLWYNGTSGRIVQWLMNASVVRTAGSFPNPPAAGDANWKVLAVGDYGIGDGLGLTGTRDLVWRNSTSGRMVVWYMDNAGNRTSGLFIVPDPPAPAANWTIVGPR